MYLRKTQNSLVYHPSQSFVVMFERLKASLKQGGIFVGNFFGDRDKWNKPTDGRVFLSMEEVRALFVGMDILEFNEIDDPEGITASGDKKHWHRFDVLAQRRP